MNDVPAKLPITAIILAFNEEIHIGRCVARLTSLVERIVVIDSFSTDQTVEIAKSLGAEVLQNKFKSHAAQFQWGIDEAQIATAWTMRIDSDEYLEPSLQAAIATRLTNTPLEIAAFGFKFKVIFKGKFIRWGGYYRLWKTALWRTGFGQIEQRWMDEKIVISSGETVRLTGGDLVDENLKDIGWWTDKHNRYATLQMIDFVARKYGLFQIDQRLETVGNRDARWRRFLRNKVYGGAPLYLRALLYFVQRYFLRLGFLDGRMGFVWHTLQGFWFFMLMDAKIDEAELHIAEHGVESFPAYLRNRYGIDDLAPSN